MNISDNKIKKAFRIGAAVSSRRIVTIQVQVPPVKKVKITNTMILIWQAVATWGG